MIAVFFQNQNIYFGKNGQDEAYYVVASVVGPGVREWKKAGDMIPCELVTDIACPYCGEKNQPPLHPKVAFGCEACGAV